MAVCEHTAGGRRLDHLARQVHRALKRVPVGVGARRADAQLQRHVQDRLARIGLHAVDELGAGGVRGDRGGVSLALGLGAFDLALRLMLLPGRHVLHRAAVKAMKVHAHGDRQRQAQQIGQPERVRARRRPSQIQRAGEILVDARVKRVFAEVQRARRDLRAQPNCGVDGILVLDRA